MKRYDRERRGSRARRWSRSQSGANMNFDRLRHVAERAELGEKREAMLAVTIPETPGSFKAFCGLLGARNITEFNYRYSDPGAAHVFVGVQVHGSAARARAWSSCCSARARGARPDRQRNGQAAHPPHGRRARAGGGQRNAVPLRISRAPRRADEVSRTAWAAAGTSACSTTATTARTTAACWSAFRCRRRKSPASRNFWTGWATVIGTRSRNPAYKLFLA